MNNHTVQSRLPEGDIMTMISDVNAKVNSENNLLGNVVGKHSLGGIKIMVGGFLQFLPPCRWRRIIPAQRLP